MAGNAAELIVRDVDALADRLAASPFEVIGEPQDLSFSDDIRAMQILGPGRELLYLTQFKRPVPGLDVPTPRCDVDRTFIVILGGPSMEALQAFYADRFGLPRPAVVASRVKGDVGCLRPFTRTQTSDCRTARGRTVPDRAR